LSANGSVTAKKFATINRRSIRAQDDGTEDQNYQIIVLKPANEIRFSLKTKHESSTITFDTNL